MLRTFRAFLWLRWRTLVNSLERTGARDTLERFSIATEKLGPIITLVLFVPSSVGLFLLALAAGFGIGTDSWLVPFEVVRYFLLFATALAIFGPIMLPTRDGGHATRFLLLPVPRAMLYVSQVAGALADPWILLTVPVTLGVPLGAAIGGRPIVAALALLAGVALLVFITGLTMMTSTAIHLLLRDRRRGDLVMLILVLGIPLVGIIPGLIAYHPSPDAREGVEQRVPANPSVTRSVAGAAFTYLPSELYRRTIRDSADRARSAGVPLTALAAVAAGAQLIAFAAFRRLLDMPMSVGARRGAAFGGLWRRAIPGLSAAASAVAFTQLRLAMRTPRGRSILAGPLLIFSAFAVLIYRSGELPFAGFTLKSGISLATFGAFVCLFSILPLAFNQFAIDKAGFTRQMLAPLSLRELLTGKAVGNALIAAGPAAFCLVLPAIVFGMDSPALWLALLFGIVGTYVLVAPAAAALSAMFPRAVDLSSIGHASNAHQAAALLGLVTFAASIAPSAALVVLALHVWRSAPAAAALVGVWMLIALVLSRLLFIPVRRIVASRCESLMLVNSGS
jgi:hypothetical protein